MAATCQRVAHLPSAIQHLADDLRPGNQTLLPTVDRQRYVIADQKIVTRRNYQGQRDGARLPRVDPVQNRTQHNQIADRQTGM